MSSGRNLDKNTRGLASEMGDWGAYPNLSTRFGGLYNDGE